MEHHHDKEQFKTKEFHHIEKTPIWYFGVAILLAALLVGGWQARNYTFMLVIVVIGITFYRIAGLKPRTREFTVNAKGVYWGDEYFPYHKIKSFYLAQTPEGTYIFLERLNYAPHLKILVPDNKLEKTVTILAKNLPFHAHRDEPLSDRFSRLLGF